MEYWRRKFLQGVDKMKKTEHERDALQKQLCLIKEIANVDNDQTREKLAEYSKNRRPESSPKNRSETVIDECAGSSLSPSYFDLTEEDLNVRTKRKGRPSAPPLSDVTPPKKAKTNQLASALLLEELEQISPRMKKKFEEHLKFLNDKLDESRVQCEQLRVQLGRQTCESAIQRENEIYRANAVQERFDEHERVSLRQISELGWELTLIQRAHRNALNELNSVPKTENSMM